MYLMKKDNNKSVHTGTGVTHTLLSTVNHVHTRTEVKIISNKNHNGYQSFSSQTDYNLELTHLELTSAPPHLGRQKQQQTKMQ